MIVVPLAAWLVCIAALWAADALGGGFLATNLVYGPAIVLAPLWLTRRDPEPDPLGLRLRPFAPALKTALALAVLTLPAYALWRGLPAQWPAADRAVGVAAAQLLGVALPEELFFRGYLQGRWARARTRTVTILGARMGWEWPAASAAFALTHAVPYGAQGLWTFFPGLLFGWAYARTGTIWAPVLYHGACNALVFLLSRGGA